MSSLQKSTVLRALVVALKYFGMLMVVVYVVVGIIVLLRSEQVFSIPGNYSLPVGIALILYGLFRGYRIYERHFQDDHQE